MKSFKQFAEDGAAGVGTATGGVAGAGDNPSKTVPVPKKMQKKYVAAAMEEIDPAKKEQESKHTDTSASVKQRLIRHKVAKERETEHSLDKRATIVKNIPNSGTVPSSKSSPRKITGAVNMESFANFHKKNTKIKASTSGVGPQNFMTKENWVVKKGTEVVSKHKSKDDADVKAMKHPLYKVSADDVKEDTVKNQKELIAANSKTAEDPTGFAKSTKGRLIDIGNQVLNKQKAK